MKSTCRLFLLLLMILIACLSVAATTRPAKKGPGSKAIKVCPKCAREMQADWKYCPYHGALLKTLQTKPAKAVIKEPKEVLYSFLQAISSGDKSGIRQTIDVKGIVETILSHGIEKLKIPKKRMAYLKREFVPEAAKRLKSLILDVLVSQEIKDTIKGISLSKGEFDLLFEQEITGNTARVFAADPSSSEEVFFRRIADGRWQITRFPDLF